MATYGLQLPDFSWIVDADPPTTMDRLRAAAEAAEASGFSSLWVMDPPSCNFHRSEGLLRRFSRGTSRWVRWPL